MWVVKLGGSLAYASELPRWLSALAEGAGGRAIIVPGGGPFADQVRHAQSEGSSRMRRRTRWRCKRWSSSV